MALRIMERESDMVKQDFNLEWTFYQEGRENQKEKVSLPHDAMIYEKRSRNAVTAGACGYFPGGKYIYEKIFQASNEWIGKSVVLEFEGVYKTAEVYLNGKLIGTNIYGYSNFYIDIKEFIQYGVDNHIKVIADNSKCPNSRWYSGSGIYRKVNLYVGGEYHILPDGVKITTLGEGRVQVEAAVTGGEQLRAVIYDKEEMVAEAVAEVKDFSTILSLSVPDARLWNAENPYLYECRMELIKNGEKIDLAKEIFGIRMLSWSVGRRIEGDANRELFFQPLSH